MLELLLTEDVATARKPAWDDKLGVTAEKLTADWITGTYALPISSTYYKAHAVGVDDVTGSNIAVSCVFDYSLLMIWHTISHE